MLLRCFDPIAHFQNEDKRIFKMGARTIIFPDLALTVFYSTGMQASYIEAEHNEFHP